MTQNNLNLSWKNVFNTNMDNTVLSLAAASAIAKKNGYQYYIRANEIYDVDQHYSVGSINELRIYLSVPYEEKDEAKKRKAKWDPELSKWYSFVADIERLCQWTSEDERVYLNCPEEHYPYAQSRGAIKSKDKRLFIPTYYWLNHNLKEICARLCYWLPPEHPYFHKFKTTGEAATWLSINGGYMPVNAYLPSESAYLEELCKKENIYICNVGNPYFRWKHWDEW